MAVKLSSLSKDKKKQIVREHLFAYSLLAYPLLLFCVFYIYVNLRAILLAFQKLDGNYNFAWCGLDNFRQLFADLSDMSPLMRTAFANSFLNFALSTVIGLPLTLLFSFVVFKKCRGTKIFRIVVMMPTIISGLLMGLIFKRLMISLPSMFDVAGVNFPNMMTNTRYVYGLSVFFSIWTGFSTTMMVYPNMMENIDKEVLESSRLDGCTAVQELWHIIIPMIIPTMSTFMVTSVSGILTTGGPIFLLWGFEAPTEVYNIGYVIFRRVNYDGQVWYGYISALGLICTAIMVPITLGVKKFFEKVDPINEY